MHNKHGRLTRTPLTLSGKDNLLAIKLTFHCSNNSFIPLGMRALLKGYLHMLSLEMRVEHLGLFCHPRGTFLFFHYPEDLPQ